MSIDYASIADGALSAIADAGGPLTLTIASAAAYDPSTGTATSTPVAYGVTGVLLPFGGMDRRIMGFNFGTDIAVQADHLVLLAAKGLAVQPKPGSTITVPSGPHAGVWRILASDTLAPAGVPVLHGLAVAR
jgi:hypothetical protein